VTGPWRFGRRDLEAGGRRPALSGMGDDVGYHALAARAEGVAEALGAAGIAAGDRVALISGVRAHDEGVGLAGILLAGAVVVPLDPAAPAARLAGICDSAGVRAVVHDAAAAKHLPELARIELAEDGHVLASVGSARRVTTAPDDSLCCLLHTSGSTGVPKPVPIGWAGMDAFTGWMIGLVGLAAADRVLRVAELTFDLAWFDHLATWRAGATLCTSSRRNVATGPSLVKELARLRPTIIYGVPSLFTKVVAAMAPDTPEPRIVCFAGEVYPPRELAKLAERLPAARLFNLFGPTETNVCTYWEVERDRLDGESEIPIGAACPYAECRIVDEEGRTIDGAGRGELWVRGPTALGGEHCTGDGVERGADGLYWFRGRLDRLAKIRGYRVHPVEVESVLGAHPRVREAAVVVREHPRLGKILCAFVTLDEPRAVDARSLRIHLSERLPPYMIPDVVEEVGEMPRTSTGKIDHRAL
jgi:L-proline---[L-prolyl-carrier protein] ligase